MRFGQKEPGLDPWIQKEGCALLSTLHAVGLDLSVEAVNACYQRCRADGCFTEDNLIIWDKLMASLRWQFGVRWEFKSFATAKYIPAPGEKELLLFYISPATPTHFTTGGGHGEVEYDPLGNKVAPKHWRLKGKRILKEAA